VTKIHSSHFRTLSDLFPVNSEAAGKTILLVGGGNSAGETAAAVAMQLSDAAWSPDRTLEQRYKDCKIVHITPRPIYGLPPYHEYEKGSKTYVPIDFKLYDLSKRQPEMPSYAGQQAMEVRDIVHNVLQTMVGGDQSDLGSEALVPAPKGDDRGTVYVALSETYSEFVRSGAIDVRAGRVTGISKSGTATVEHEADGEQAKIENVGAVIYATGYTPSTALNFLADDVKTVLQYDPNSARLPVVLEQWQTMNPSVPELAFVGFYEGPYWPVMEMQARLTASRWTCPATPAPQRPYEDVDTLLQLRQAMQKKSLGVPQYWFGDYTGYMTEIASRLQLPLNHGPFGEREGCPSPARYLPSSISAAEKKQADAIMRDLHTLWHDCVDSGRFVARAVLRAMHGHWIISRRIESRHPAFSGTLEGSASFHPRVPTAEGFDLEYLYIESGTFTSAASGMHMQARRRYVYRYSERHDKLSVWFVKPDYDLEVDYLFHDLSFVSPSQVKEAGVCVAKADHLCVEDMYWTQYTLPMEAIVLRRFELKHTVKGPGKDYVATTEYTRPAKAGKASLR